MATEIGDTLRAARHRQGRSLADAAAETRVRETYLAALEQEDFSAVGDDVYVKGFLRSYARYLGVDPDPLLEQFRSTHQRPEDHAPIHNQRPMGPIGPVGTMGPLGQREGPPQWLIVAGLVLGVLLILGLLGLRGGGSEQAAPPAPSPVEENAVTETGARVDTERASGGPDPSEPAVPATDGEPFDRIVVTLEVVSGESYIRSDVGDPRVDGVKSEGYTETFSNGDQDLVRLRIGDAGKVRLTVNGEDLGALGDNGDIVQVTCEIGETACDVRVIEL